MCVWVLCVKGTTISYGAFPLHIEEITQLLIRHLLIVFQEGDVIELCQVSDIRAGGLPKVSVIFCFISTYRDVAIEKLYFVYLFHFIVRFTSFLVCACVYYVEYIKYIKTKYVENSMN